jgi:SAM-dependent methyltransferase
VTLEDTIPPGADALDTPDVASSFDVLIEEYEDTDRGEWQNPALVLDKLGDLEGKVVADLGSGTGYFTFRMASLAEKVIAIDIEQRFLDYIEERKLEVAPRVANIIETRLTVENDPNLIADEVDAILMVNVYYYLKKRVDYMKKVHASLKSGGKLVLVDFKPGELPLGPLDNKVAPSQVLSDLKKAGFNNLNIDTSSLQYQYIINGTK